MACQTEADGRELVRPSGQTYAVDVALATAYGTHPAFLIGHFQYWIRNNKTRKQNLIEGRTWMYQTYKEIADHFPFMTYKMVRTAVDSLIADGVIIKGNFNKLPGDNTCWFAFTNEEIFIPNLKNPRDVDPPAQPVTPPLPKKADPCPNGQTPAQMGRAIPNTKPNTIQDISKITTNHQGVATQAGGLVGGFLKDLEKKQESHQGQKLYACLESLDISHEAKIGFMKRFSEETVSNAVKHCTKKSFKIDTNLESCIASYCRNPQWITKTKEEIQAEKMAEADRIREAQQDRKRMSESIANEVHKVCPPTYHEMAGLGGKILRFPNWLVKNESDRVEIHNPNNYQQKESVYFDDKGFRNKFEHFLRKFELPVPKLVASLP